MWLKECLLADSCEHGDEISAYTKGPPDYICGLMTRSHAGRKQTICTHPSCLQHLQTDPRPLRPVFLRFLWFSQTHPVECFVTTE